MAINVYRVTITGYVVEQDFSTDGPFGPAHMGPDHWKPDQVLEVMGADVDITATLVDSIPQSEDVATPDLLTAAKEFLASVENVDFSVEDTGLYDRIPWAQLEQAIAKADSSQNLSRAFSTIRKTTA